MIRKIKHERNRNVSTENQKLCEKNSTSINNEFKAYFNKILSIN